MFHLMTPRTPTAQRRARRFGRLVAQAVRSVVAPAALVKAEATTAPAAAAAPVAESADLYTPDEMPEVAAIEAAALGYDLAADSARAADRAKRKHKKILDRLPAGRYGNWIVERVASNRQVVDIEAVRATYERLGLGPVPMRTPAPSLKVKPAPVESAPAVEVADEDRELVAA